MIVKDSDTMDNGDAAALVNVEDSEAGNEVAALWKHE